MVEIDAYAADCRVHGTVDFGEGRVSDRLNQITELIIRDARLEGISDGRTVAMPDLTIARDELCAVVATGLRGDTARRLNTRTRLVEAEVGPYLIVGWVHGTPTSEPLDAIHRNQAWVALTEATVMYRCGGSDVREEMATILVNRHRMRSFRAVETPSLDLHWDKPRVPENVAPVAPSRKTAPKPARPKSKRPRPPAPSRPPA
jgi:hypothetical protein